MGPLLEYARKHHGYKGQNMDKLRSVLHGEPFLCKGEFIDLSRPLDMLVKKHISQIEQDVKKESERDAMKIFERALENSHTERKRAQPMKAEPRYKKLT